MIYRKLGEIQLNLLKYNLTTESDLSTVLSAVQKECCLQELTCWFNIIEDSLILKIKPWDKESLDINVRIPREKYDDYDGLKLQVLQNTFLIHDETTSIESEKVNDSDGEDIVLEENEMPKPIEKVKEILEDKNIPTTRRNIAIELGMHDLSSEAMNASREYLKQFSAEEII